MSAAATVRAWRSGVKGEALLVLLALADVADANGENCQVSPSTLSARTGFPINKIRYELLPVLVRLKAIVMHEGDYFTVEAAKCAFADEVLIALVSVRRLPQTSARPVKASLRRRKAARGA